jgi:2-polyprenyl-3-methyl-5-hydroxy-6-metoxy-1,4-benzoquinol methylase
MNETLPLITLANRLVQILSFQDEETIYKNLSHLYECLQIYADGRPLEAVNEALTRTIQSGLMHTHYIPCRSQVLKLLYKIEGTTTHLDDLYKCESTCFYKIMNLRKHLVLQEILKYSSREKSLLDIGCAEGVFLIALKGRFRKRYGVDISSERLERLQERDPEVQILCLDLNQDKINLEDASIDIILATEILEHIYNYPHLFREMTRVLTKGGRIIGTIPNKDSILYILRRYLLGKKEISWNHPNMWNLQSFKKTASDFGLIPDKFYCFGVELPHVNFIGRINFLQTTFFNLPLMRNFSTFILFNLLKE